MGHFSRLVSTLLARRLAVCKQGRIKALPKKETFAIKNISVIEAKLNDWRRALIQARRHLWFTDNCYVVIPEGERTKKNRVASACRRHRVGLMMVSKKGDLITVVSLKKSGPYNTYLAWLLNESLLQEVKDG